MRRDCDRERLSPALRELFVPLAPDPEAEAFGSRAGHGAFRAALRGVLRRLRSDFDADGLLGTHPMFLFGEAGARELVGAYAGGRLLDVGAGSGDVTQSLRPLFRETVATELSAPCARRLRSRKIRCHRVDLARAPLPEPGPFDVVTLLNVLDRCDRPRSLLRAARALASRALLISVPLPVRAHVDVGGATIDPAEPICGRGASWEQALNDLAPALAIEGTRIARIARAPYLSRGAGASLVALDAALVVLAIDR